MSDIESKYDQFVSTLKNSISNVDENLMLKVMYLERILPDAPPRVDLDIEYKKGTNLNQKKETFYKKHGFPLSLSEHGIHVVSKMNMTLIENIAQDSDILKISGRATPSTYCI